MTHNDEAELLRAAASGDAAAVVTLWKRYERLVNDQILFFFPRTAPANLKDVADAVREKAIIALQAGKIKKKYGTWIRSTVDNHCKGLYRGLGYHEKFEEHIRRQGIDLQPNENLDTLVDLTWQIIEKYSEEDAKIIQMVFLQSRKPRNIVKILNKSKEDIYALNKKFSAELDAAWKHYNGR